MECASVKDKNDDDDDLEEKRIAELDNRIRDNGLARIGAHGTLDELVHFYSTNAKDYTDVSVNIKWLH